MDHTSEKEVLSRRLDMATRAARIAVWEWDLETDALYWSPIFMEILGIEPEAFRGHLSDFVDRVVPEDRERVGLALDAHTARGVPYDIEYEMFHASGRRVAIAARGQATMDEGGKPLRMVGTVRDITDQRSLEARLLEAERIAQIGHWIVDLAENRLTWSPETFRIHGLEPDDLEPDVERAMAFYHPDDRPLVERAFESAITTGQFQEVEARLQLDGGELRHVYVNGAGTLAADGTPERVFGIIQDRSEFVRKERQLEQASRIEAIGQLAGGVAHDFNNLMSVMIGNLELLRLSARDKLTSSDGQLIEEAINAIMMGRDLTQSLLSFARVATLRPERIEASDLLTTLHNVLRRTLPASIDLRVAECNASRCVFADRGNLEACLINLAINARDAIEPPGFIALSAEDVDIGAETGSNAWHGLELEPGPYVAFAVVDSGRGIAPEDVGKVFEPFYTTKSVGEGSGLGLSRVKGFAEQSGGAVTMESEPGRGTTVRIVLPAGRAADGDETTRAATDLPEMRPANVLLVEDLEPVRRVLETQLARLGHRVTSASTGAEALKAFHADPTFDIVISDIVMPGELQGPDLVRDIRSNRPTMPVIYMSGYSREATERMHGIEADDVCLTKPVTMSELADVLRGMLQ